MKKAIFLDRDGTINVDRGYINHPDNLHLISGAGAAIAQLNRSGWQVFLISNQSGVARGVIHQQALPKIQQKLKDELALWNAHLDAEFLCLHHVSGKVPHLSYDCDCRKPKQKFFHEAMEQFDFDPAESWVVGDKPSDIQFGKKAGMKTALVLTGYGRGELRYFRQNWPDWPDLIATDLSALVQFLLNKKPLPNDFAVPTPWPGSFHFHIENEQINRSFFSSNPKCEMPPVAKPLAWQTAMQIEEYFDGCRTEFSLPLQASGSAFEQQIWQHLQNIKYGETASYQQLSEMAGHPQAARAAGNALKKNPLPLFIPCHRILPQNQLAESAQSAVGNYLAGSDIKRWLLKLECAHKKCE